MNKTKSRDFYGTLASVIGIIVNILLACGKILVGVLFGALSVLADGLNNLTDCGSSIISMLSFKLSSKPADKEHPYGHERIEYVCSIIVIFIILLVAFTVGKESITKIISPEKVEFSFLVLGVLFVSIIAKVGLCFYFRFISKKINSDILKATSVDCLTDSISTGVVLISMLIMKFIPINIDGYAGLLVALFIAWSGIGLIKETFSKLIGQAPDESFIKEIKQKILSYEGVLGLHDLNVYCYGPNKFFASVHIELDAEIDVLTSHELVDEIERDFANDTNIILTGHLDPIVINDEEVNSAKERVELFLKNIDCRFSVHDFRMVKGENRTNVLFDIAIPFDPSIDKHNLKQTMETEVKKINSKYCPIITIEHSI